MATAAAARLVVQCRVQPGVVAAVGGFLAEHGATITALTQHATDGPDGWCFLRVEFLGGGERGELMAAFATAVGAPFGMRGRLGQVGERRRVAILASREDHCVLDLLWRAERGELPAEIAVVVSDHPDLRDGVEALEVPFAHVPSGGDAPAAGARLLDALDGRADLLVVAGYRPALRGEVVADLGVPAIGVHHAFLPPFSGADPYVWAHDRGVKMVGATAHYLTGDPDEGPIIEQDVVRVGHALGAEGLIAAGAEVERTVLGRAVRWHLEDRVLVDGERTVVL